MKPLLSLLFIVLLFACGQHASHETKGDIAQKDTLPKAIPTTENVVKEESGSEFTKVYEQQTCTNPSADSVTTLFMKSSSTIKVKKNTFVYADNNQLVNEPVVIKYREIKQMTDAIGSSISMIYDSANVKQNFESAGMFEFYAYTKSSGRIVKIAKGKSIEINYATDVKDNDYNLYQYQNKAQNWTYLSRASHSSKVTKAQNKVEISMPLKPRKPANNGTAFDLDIDVDKFPELNSYRGIVWEYAAESKADNPTANKWIFAENWDKVSLESYTQIKGCYKITLSTKKKTFTTIIKPALTGNDYQVAMQKYQQAMQQYQKRSQTTNKSITLTISDFGIYNIDRIASIKNQYTIEADFELENSTENSAGRTVYLIYNQNRNVIAYTQSGLNAWRKFTFDAKMTDNNLLMILPNNKIAIGNSADFEIIKQNKHKSYRFKLKVSDKSIEHLSDLNNLF
jgi:hypothetical protein